MHLTEREDIWPTANLITSLSNQYINFNSFLFIIHPLFLTTHHGSPVWHRANTEKQTTVHSGIQNKKTKTKTNEPITHCFCVWLYCYLIIWLSQPEHRCLSRLWAKTAQICLICNKAVTVISKARTPARFHKWITRHLGKGMHFLNFGNIACDIKL